MPHSNLPLNSQIEMLRTLSPAQLRQKYLDVFGEPSRTGNKDFLFKRVAWRIQSLAEGGLSERALRRAKELARDADLRTTMPVHLAGGNGIGRQDVPLSGQRLPLPGTVLTRHYQGTLVQVTVLAKGFEWQGQVYRSLSAVAKAVTGTHWNGHLFFGLRDGVRS